MLHLEIVLKLQSFFTGYAVLNVSSDVNCLEVKYQTDLSLKGAKGTNLVKIAEYFTIKNYLAASGNKLNLLKKHETASAY